MPSSDVCEQRVTPRVTGFVSAGEIADGTQSVRRCHPEAEPDRQIWRAASRPPGLRDRPDEDEVPATKQRLSTDFCQQHVDVEVSLVDRMAGAI